MKVYPYLSEAIARVFEELRKQKKMPKSYLADFAGIERCYLRDILKGNRNPTVNTIFSLCEALQVDPIEFFQRVQKEITQLSLAAKQENG